MIDAYLTYINSKGGAYDVRFFLDPKAGALSAPAANSEGAMTHKMTFTIEFDKPLKDPAVFVHNVTKALEHAKQPSGWQTIETAPRDGTEIVGLWFIEGMNATDAAIVTWEAMWTDFKGEEYREPDLWCPLPEAPS